MPSVSLPPLISSETLGVLINLATAMGAPNAPEHAPVIGLAKAIQLSVAPVFLVTGISGLLGCSPTACRG